MLRSPEQKKVSETEAFLDQRLNFPLLRKIFAEVVRRCGFDESKMNFIERDGITIAEASINAGQYDTPSNHIEITDDLSLIAWWDKRHPEVISKKTQSARRRAQERYGNENIKILHRLVHEEGHAISHRICTGNVIEEAIEEEKRVLGKKSWAEFGRPGYMQSGLKRIFNLMADSPESRYKESGAIVFSMLNEAVNEKLARIITLRYLEESQDFEPRVIDVFRKNAETNNKRFNYENEVKILNEIIGQIAQKNGISEEIISQAFFRAYLEGELFEDVEVRELFEKTFGPEFLDDLAELKTGDFSEGKRGVKFMAKYGLHS